MTVERKAAGVPEHVRVRLEDQLGHLSSSLDHSREASSRKRRAALRGEHEGRFRLLLALEPSDRMCAGSALLDPADVQGEYQTNKKIREGHLFADFVIVEGYDGPQPRGRATLQRFSGLFVRE
jgi:hypothetical protein